jgi:hypothetical protein
MQVLHHLRKCKAVFSLEGQVDRNSFSAPFSNGINRAVGACRYVVVGEVLEA